MIFWMLYAAGIGVLLAAGGWASERFCETMGWPRRFPWMVALALAVAIPLFARGPTPAPEAPAASLPAVTAVAEVVTESASASPGPGLDRAALVVWGASSLATLLIFGAVLGVMARSRRRWPRRSVDGEEVYVSAGFGPALIGVARPSVVIPEWLFGASGREASRFCTSASTPAPETTLLSCTAHLSSRSSPGIRRSGGWSATSGARSRSTATGASSPPEFRPATTESCCSPSGWDSTNGGCSLPPSSNPDTLSNGG